MNSFYILTPSNGNNNLYEIDLFNEQNNKGTKEILLFNESIIPNTGMLYYAKLLSLPYNIRKKILLESNCKKSFYDISKELFNRYCQLSNKINYYLSNKYENVYVCCSIFYNDFCLLIPENSYEINQVKVEVEKFLQLFNKSLYNDFDNEQHSYDNFIKKSRCIKSDRQFVKHNPMFYKYLRTMSDLENIKCDSLDRKQELSLFSALVLKDLVEETHLYWIYDSGDLRYENPEIAYILKSQNSLYFEYFNLFCNQAKDGNKYNDWIWSLVFLTQKLLYTLGNIPTAKIDNSNFYGFVPIIKNIKEENNEIVSLFTRHISRKFCHGFLIVPFGAIYSIIEHLPAFIHEFFHYIPPLNRPERNKAIFDLVIHSVLFDLRQILPKKIYEDFFNGFRDEIICLSKQYYDDIFNADSMEYIEKLRILFLKLDFEIIYNSIVETFQKKPHYDHRNVFFELKERCHSKWLRSTLDYVNIFTLFFREIRSDIAMCSFFEINLNNYIRILAYEPLFADMNKENCGDSTILRFGYMCNHLYMSSPNASDNDDWLSKTKKIIYEQMKSLSESNVDKHLRIEKHYNNLIDYLDEYHKISIELDDNEVKNKSISLLDSIIDKYELINAWKEFNNSYADNSFVMLLKELYQNYMDEDYFANRLTTICGAKILFRDLYTLDC